MAPAVVVFLSVAMRANYIKMHIGGDRLWRARNFAIVSHDNRGLLSLADELQIQGPID